MPWSLPSSSSEAVFGGGQFVTASNSLYPLISPSFREVMTSDTRERPLPQGVCGTPASPLHAHCRTVDRQLQSVEQAVAYRLVTAMTSTAPVAYMCRYQTRTGRSSPSTSREACRTSYSG